MIGVPRASGGGSGKGGAIYRLLALSSWNHSQRVPWRPRNTVDNPSRRRGVARRSLGPERVLPFCASARVLTRAATEHTETRRNCVASPSRRTPKGARLPRTRTRHRDDGKSLRMNEDAGSSGLAPAGWLQQVIPDIQTRLACRPLRRAAARGTPPVIARGLHVHTRGPRSSMPSSRPTRCRRTGSTCRLRKTFILEQQCRS